MEDERPEAEISLGLFLVPGGEMRALTVGPGEPGPGDEWRVPTEPGSATATVPDTEPAQSREDQPPRPDR